MTRSRQGCANGITISVVMCGQEKAWGGWQVRVTLHVGLGGSAGDHVDPALRMPHPQPIVRLRLTFVHRLSSPMVGGGLWM